MLSLIAEAALRGLVLVAVLRAGQSLLRLRNVQTRTALWRCGLAACCCMPLLVLWHPMALPPASGALRDAVISHAGAALPSITVAVRAAPDAEPVAVDFSWLAGLVYGGVAMLLLARLGVGVARLWLWSRAARPAAAGAGFAADVRISEKLAVPVTFGATILLPAASRHWPAAKRRAVINHEMAHVAHRDFTILLISAAYRAIFWFNPAAWWLHNELCSLAEARSDAAALADAPGRFEYAEILLGIAAQSRAVPAGVPMARPATINRRISQILRATTSEPPMTRRRYLFVAACVAIPALLAGGIAQRAAAGSTVAIDAATLDHYAGAYQLAPGAIMTIVHQGNGLTAQLTGQPALPIFAEGGNRFDYKVVQASITFNTDAGGNVTSLTLHQNGADHPAPRISAAQAQADNTALQKRIAHNQPLPGSEAALRTTIAAQIAGNPDYDHMTPVLAAAVRRQTPMIGAMLTQLGAVRGVKFLGVTPKGWDLYDVRFANGDTQWRITLDSSGKISGLLLRPTD